MTPGSFDIPIYRGAKYEFALEFMQLDDNGVITANPVDLTGLGPFVAAISNRSNGQVLATGTVTSDYDATGTISFAFTPDQTRALPAGIVGFGIRDALGNAYIQAEVPALSFSPPPP